MTTSARHLHAVTGSWQDTDPVLAALRECVRYFVREAFRCPVPGVYP